MTMVDLLRIYAGKKKISQDEERSLLASDMQNMMKKLDEMTFALAGLDGVTKNVACKALLN